MTRDALGKGGTSRKRSRKPAGGRMPRIAELELAIGKPRPQTRERRPVAAALGSSQERYRSLIENVPVALSEIDLSSVKTFLTRLCGKSKNLRACLLNNPGAMTACLDRIKVINVNRATLELFQGDSVKVSGSALPEIFGAALPDILRDCLQALAEGKTTFVVEKVQCTVAGQTRYVRAALAIAPGSEDTWARLLISLRDITAFIELQEHLELHNAILRLFLDAASQNEFLDRAARLFYHRTGCRCLGIRVLDKNGNIPYVWHEGFSPEFLASENSLSVKRDRCACIRIIRGQAEVHDDPALTPGGSFHCDDLSDFWERLTEEQKSKYRGVCLRSGFRTMSLVPIRYGGQIVGAIHIADEKAGALPPGKLPMFESAAALVGEAFSRFSVEEKSRENEARLAEAQRIARVGNWEWDVSGGEIIWSDETYGIYGLAPQQLVPTYEVFLSFVHPEDRDFVIDALRAASHRDKPYDIEHRIVRPDGSVRIVHGKAVTTFGENGKPVRMAGTVHDITEHKLAEEQLRGLSARLVEIQEEERRTIARDLHDQVGQSLTILNILVEQAIRLVPNVKAQALLNDAKALVKELTGQVREISLNLRPSILDDLGLLPALLWHFERFTMRTNISVHFEHGELDADLPGNLRTTAYRIVQEALNNVARYAQVTEVSVRAFARDGTLYIEVEDHGIGFEPEKITFTSNGISGMEERARAVGGELTVDSSPGFGTCVALEMPIPDSRH